MIILSLLVKYQLFNFHKYVLAIKCLNDSYDIVTCRDKYVKFKVNNVARENIQNEM